MYGSVYKPGFMVWNAKHVSLQHVFDINISTEKYILGSS